jgi:hypothetical protein
VLAAALVRSVAFVGIYRSAHPWLAASEWFYAHVPPGAVIAVEQWDHPLPLGGEGYGYEVRTLPIFDDEWDAEKWTAMDSALAEADYVVIASQRGYGTLARRPERYPRMATYYRALFAGESGFEPVVCFGRYVKLGPLALLDDPAAGLGFSLPAMCYLDVPLTVRLGALDESFVVYDHPQTIVFRRVSSR